MSRVRLNLGAYSHDLEGLCPPPRHRGPSVQPPLTKLAGSYSFLSANSVQRVDGRTNQKATLDRDFKCRGTIGGGSTYKPLKLAGPTGNEKHCYRRRTARRTTSVRIWSTAAQLPEQVVQQISRTDRSNGVRGLQSTDV